MGTGHLPAVHGHGAVLQASTVMAYRVMACIVVAYIVMAMVPFRWPI